MELTQALPPQKTQTHTRLAISPPTQLHHISHSPITFMIKEWHRMDGWIPTQAELLTTVSVLTLLHMQTLLHSQLAR